MFLLGGSVLVAAAILLLWPANRPDIETGTLLDKPKSLPQFEFVDHRGASFNRRDLVGQWSLLFTGFTTCPDVCPATISVLTTLDKKLRADGDGTEIRMIFLSVDPERDALDNLARYVAYFSPSLTGVTGDMSGIEEFCDEIGMSFIHIPGSGGSYTVDHSGALVLIDPRARVAGYFKPPFDMDLLVKDLQTIADS